MKKKILIIEDNLDMLNLYQGGYLGIFLSLFRQQTVRKLWSWPLRLQLLHQFSSVIRPFNS